MLTVLSIAAVLAIVAALGLVVASRREPEVGLVDGRLRMCPTSLNCVSSEGGGDAAVEPFRIPGGVTSRVAFESLELVLNDRADVRGREPEYMHAVFTTPLMRFRDDFEARLDDAARVIHVRSASRVGRSDLGANRRRVEDLRAAWAERLVSSSERE